MSSGIASILTIPVLFFSVIIHECAHGYVALRNGDTTARDAGRLTLNPIPHIDPFGTILLPFLLFVSQGGHPRVLFGWAKPVPVNPFNFTRMKEGLLQVAASGPLSNLALCFLCTLGFRASLQFGGHNVGNGFSLMLAYGIQINAVLAVFNLLPIPPLDGSMILAALLPAQLADKYRRFQILGFLGIVLVIATPLGYYLIMAPASFIVATFARIVGVPFVF